MKNIFQEMSRAQSAGQAFVLVTVVEISGSAPRHLGAKMIVYADGRTSGTIGGGSLEKSAIEQALKLFDEPAAVLHRFELEKDLAMQCGGGVTLFLDPIVPAQQLFIFGAGHVGRAVTRIAYKVGFRVTVVDNRPEFARGEKLPEADAVQCEEYLSALKKMTFGPESYIVIVTHNHEHDFEILQACVREPVRYLGMIGSRSKSAKALAELKKLGIPDQTLARVRSPIGLELGGETPEEIALAITAELVAVRNGIDPNRIGRAKK